jgi:hypothetical protein
MLWLLLFRISVLILQSNIDSSNCALVLADNANSELSLQSIGFVGPGLSLIGLATARNPSVASAWLTLAFGLKSFGHSGFLVNFQVSNFCHVIYIYIDIFRIVTPL